MNNSNNYEVSIQLIGLLVKMDEAKFQKKLYMNIWISYFHHLFHPLVECLCWIFPLYFFLQNRNLRKQHLSSKLCNNFPKINSIRVQYFSNFNSYKFWHYQAKTDEWMEIWSFFYLMFVSFSKIFCLLICLPQYLKYQRDHTFFLKYFFPWMTANAFSISEL